MSRLEKLMRHTSITHLALCHYRIYQQQRRLQLAAEQLEHLGHRLVPASETFFNAQGKTECHIIGSGWSLNRSKILATSDKAYVVGFNSAALAELRFDSYFVEFAGPEYSELGDHQAALVREYLLGTDCRTFFKNLSLPRNSAEIAAKKFGGLATYVRDLNLNCFSPKYLPQTLKLLLQDDDVHLRQFMSTIVTIMLVARRSGFKKIVLHGVDFGGEYFFNTPDYSGNDALKPPTVAGIYSKNIKPGAHETNKPGIGLQILLPILRDELAKSGVMLMAAIPESPSSQLLGSYTS